MQPGFVTLSPFLFAGALLSPAGHAQAGDGSAAATRLAANTATILPQTGGEQALRIDAGSPRARRPYVVLGSAGGTHPGFRVGPSLVPLNPDAYFLLTARGANPLLLGGVGLLDAGGRASSSVRVPPAIARLLEWRTLHHAALVLGQGGIDASNAIPLRFTKRPSPRPPR